MRGIVKAVPVAMLFVCVVTGAKAAEGRWLKDPNSGCAIFDASAGPYDSVGWSGDCVDGRASGPGTATFTRDGKFVETFNANFEKGAALDGHVITQWGEGWSYDGEETHGRFNGVGVLVNDKNDRFEGEWVDGKMNGFGVVQRANGERYAGLWQNNMPNGKGELRRADGSVVQGLFADGRLVQGDADKSAVASSASDTKVKGDAPLFKDIAGETLVGVDGSTVSLNFVEDGMELQSVRANGAAKKSTFTFMSDRLGTVVEEGEADAENHVTGFFRVADNGIEVHYADGRVETLSAHEDGLQMVQQEPGQATTCQGWYVKGHLFSEAEKKAALAEYASQLGLQAVGNRTADCAWPGSRASDTASSATAPKGRTDRRVQAKTSSRLATASSHPSSGSVAALEPVTVKTSNVHLIDGDAPAPSDVVLGGPAVAMAASMGAPAAAAPRGAAHCLAVESDGTHWGFRNQCSYSVQFAYCVMHSGVPLTACDSGSVQGSVAANGFGALMADTSLGETNTDHDFRWIACDGGAGEVVAHLDHADPPSGSCERAAIQTATSN